MEFNTFIFEGKQLNLNFKCSIIFLQKYTVEIIINRTWDYHRPDLVTDEETCIL